MSLAPGVDTKTTLEVLAANGGDPNMIVGRVTEELIGTRQDSAESMDAPVQGYGNTLAQQGESTQLMLVLTELYELMMGG